MVQVDLILWLDILGTIAFALSGALMAGKHQLDIFGVIVLASVTAVGGGTLRDILLNTDMVFWIDTPRYLGITLITAVATYFIAREPGRLGLKLLLLFDAIGIALFVVIGTEKALTYDVPYFSAMVLGTITCIAGGMMRDTLCREIPLVLRKEVYALACVAGSGIYCLCHYLQVPTVYAVSLAFVTTLTLRLLAMYYNISLPAFSLDKR